MYIAFMTMLIAMGIITYIIGICVQLNILTTYDTEIIKSSSCIFGPHIISHHREATPKDIWRSLFWPFEFLYGVIKTFVLLINIIVHYVLLLFGFRYKETRLYKAIDEWADI